MAAIHSYPSLESWVKHLVSLLILGVTGYVIYTSAWFPTPYEEAITGVRSRTRLEQYDVSQLQQCVSILMCLEHRLKAEPAATEADLLSQVQMAKEDLRGKPQPTLLEARLRQSVDQAEKVNGAASQEAGQPF